MLPRQPAHPNQPSSPALPCRPLMHRPHAAPSPTSGTTGRACSHGARQGVEAGSGGLMSLGRVLLCTRPLGLQASPCARPHARTAQHAPDAQKAGPGLCKSRGLHTPCLPGPPRLALPCPASPCLAVPRLPALAPCPAGLCAVLLTPQRTAGRGCSAQRRACLFGPPMQAEGGGRRAGAVVEGSGSGSGWEGGEGPQAGRHARQAAGH